MVNLIFSGNLLLSFIIRKKQNAMEDPPQKDDWSKNYRLVFWLGIIYILLLGLFTWIFNTPL